MVYYDEYHRPYRIFTYTGPLPGCATKPANYKAYWVPSEQGSENGYWIHPGPDWVEILND